MKIKIVLITGFPASGKTTIGNELAKRMRIPFLSKDDIKEHLFDRLGWEDREWSKKLSLVSYDSLYYYAETLLKANVSFVIESNFKPEFDNPKVTALIERYDVALAQILYHANGGVLFERFKSRAESGLRHPGHVDTSNYKEFKKILLEGQSEPLSVAGAVIDVDTTDFTKVDVDQLLERIVGQGRPKS